MTRIIYIPNPDMMGSVAHEEPLPPRELLKRINTGELGLTLSGPAQHSPGSPVRQWAMFQPPLNAITVTDAPPPVTLSPRHFDVLFGLLDGLSSSEIADALGLYVGTLRNYEAELKERFCLTTREQIVARARELGWVCPE